MNRCVYKRLSHELICTEQTDCDCNYNAPGPCEYQMGGKCLSLRAISENSYFAPWEFVIYKNWVEYGVAKAEITDGRLD